MASSLVRNTLLGEGRRRLLYTAHPMSRAALEEFWYDSTSSGIFEIEERKGSTLKFRADYNNWPFPSRPVGFTSFYQYSFDGKDSRRISMEDLQGFNRSSLWLPRWVSGGDWVYQHYFGFFLPFPTAFVRFPLPLPVPVPKTPQMA